VLLFHAVSGFTIAIYKTLIRVRSITIVLAFSIGMLIHTSSSIAWILISAAIYVFDLVVRVLRSRVKDANIVAVDNEMTLVWHFFPVM
jgi:ferric-chelate reductase